MATAACFLLCDPCKDCGEEQVPVAFCLECRELYCKSCLNCHKKMTVTNSHLYVYLTGDESGGICPCDLCNIEGNKARSLCYHCRQLCCTACTNRHRKLKATMNHVIVEIICDKAAAVSSEVSTCSLDFNVTYSGAQVPVGKRDKQVQLVRKFVNKQETMIFVPDDTQATYESEQLHFNNTTWQSDMKQTSLTWAFYCKFSVRTPLDKKSTYTNRIISMPDGRICVVDCYNDRIKLYTCDYILCDEVSVSWCRAVTCVDNDTVAVATCRGDIIHYVIKRNKITWTGKVLHIDGDIYDLAYRRGEFITRYRKDNIDYTCCGRKLIVRQDRRLLLGDFINYDPVSDCVILGNSWRNEEHSVTCYTLNGHVNWRITLDASPRGIVVVHRFVLVAEYSKDTIYQISMEGRLLPTPLLTMDHGIMDPEAITYQYTQQRLLVTRFDNDDVMVFNLSQ